MQPKESAPKLVCGGRTRDPPPVMVHGERAAARQRWRLRLDDAGLVDALASVLANLDVERSAQPVAPHDAASAVADAVHPIIARLLGGAPSPRRQTSGLRAGCALAGAANEPVSYTHLTLPTKRIV